ncbi:MAG: acetyl-CoA carboxylase biotin carboxylase subunit [Sphingomonas sp. 28-62-20]|jgi:acetyl-CoA carboxylase biotin carboxylase subunit|uniref:acetyl-CoA carboxylase biotin carboxylase subunit n=1 Tax=Sphingomonas sp. 28-62-20 TaxID=1970433 RepID=UPI000BD793E1|nr:MAG: acetyl-CoA carboxylase biotin carboxylase subunit [Sphingomonas sp. 28-62-20]
MTLRRLLIANRGEIALRIVRAAKAKGVETVLAASAADRDSQAAIEADRTVVIGAAPARASYLNGDLLVHTALVTQCDAVHPGYGFLSERASFAEQCEKAGLTFVGPRAETIRLVGDKLAARALAKAAGVSMVSGSEKVDTVADALQIAEGIGYPVITKASAGGGGRGMVVANSAAELEAAFDNASHEAKEAFGDGTLYLERYVQRARHVEVQVVGDGNGNILHFGERDCSLQRRYQKMVEEAPAAILSDAVRSRLHQAAIDLLSPIKYRNAGTVEFLYDEADERFYFMEVNARIQVEHPVSEEICGIDLIQLQLDVASGAPLQLTQADIKPRGHAIEVRIIAENPLNGFMPSPGRITQWLEPQGEGVRVDTAMKTGVLVPPFYDSMIGKLIVRGADRGDALARLRAALDAFVIEGISTNLELLRAIVGHPNFVDNVIDTRWSERVLLPSYLSSKGK